MGTYLNNDVSVTIRPVYRLGAWKLEVRIAVDENQYEIAGSKSLVEFKETRTVETLEQALEWIGEELK